MNRPVLERLLCSGDSIARGLLPAKALKHAPNPLPVLLRVLDRNEKAVIFPPADAGPTKLVVHKTPLGLIES